jgi:hypothetical protein
VPPTSILAHGYSSQVDAGLGDRLEVVHEVPGQAQPEVLDLADRRLLGKGVHGALLGVGQDQVGVVAAQVDVGQVAGQGEADVEVLELVAVPVPGDPDHADLGLPVLVVSEADGHRELPPGGRGRQLLDEPASPGYSRTVRLAGAGSSR